MAAVLVGLLLSLAVMIFFVGLWRMTGAQDPVEERLRQYGVTVELVKSASSARAGLRRAWPGTTRLLAGLGLGPRLATALARADFPLTAAEFSLVVLGFGVLGLLIGMVRGGLLFGLPAALLAGALPIFYMRNRQRSRLKALTEQLPDVLTMLVGSLRAGYGLPQSIDLLRGQLPPPVSVEFGRVIRAVGVGLPLQDALAEMAVRTGSDDLSLVVTAINVQYELGGNLAQILESISDTVQDRIRMRREIRSLTAQQRLTGYVLAGMPIVTGIGLFIVNAEYMGRLFAPGASRLIPAVALLLQVVGFLVIRRIVDIEV